MCVCVREKEKERERDWKCDYCTWLLPNKILFALVCRNMTICFCHLLLTWHTETINSLPPSLPLYPSPSVSFSHKHTNTFFYFLNSNLRYKIYCSSKKGMLSHPLATLEGSNILWDIVAPPPPSKPSFCLSFLILHLIWLSLPVWLDVWQHKVQPRAGN